MDRGRQDASETSEAEPFRVEPNEEALALLRLVTEALRRDVEPRSRLRHDGGGCDYRTEANSRS